MKFPRDEKKLTTLILFTLSCFLAELPSFGAIAVTPQPTLNMLHSTSIGDWKLVASGDLNHDGNRDLLFQNTLGHIAAWFLDGTGDSLEFPTGRGLVPGSKLLYSKNLGSSKIVGVEDMNADGLSDLIFQNDQGQIAVWLLDGSGDAIDFSTPGREKGVLRIPGSHGLIYSASLGGWKIVSVIDMNADQSPDLLFQNALGQIVVWYLAIPLGKVIPNLGPFAPSSVSPPATILASFPNNPIFQQGITLLDWVTNRGLKGSRWLYSPQTLGDWKVIDAKDLNGDGIPDLVFQNASHQIAVWYLDGTGNAINFQTGTGLVPGSKGIYNGEFGNNWQLSAIADLDGDLNPDLIFQDNIGKLGRWNLSPFGIGDTVIWQKLPDVSGFIGSYTPFLIQSSPANNKTITLFSTASTTNHSNISAFGSLWRTQVTLSPSGQSGVPTAPALVISPDQIFDQTGTPFIRTTGIVKGASGKFYGLLHVGDSYPSQTGYVPAWATSDDGINWTYHGKLKIDGQVPYVWSSSAALVVQEEKPALVDHLNPANNRFMAWEDAYRIDGVQHKLVLLYSADAKSWYFYRDSLRRVQELWPGPANTNAIFMSIAKTPFGYHMISGNTWPPDRNIHLFSCNGVKWRILENYAPTFGEKGTNLYYEASTGLIHAITSFDFGTKGIHRTTRARQFACPN